MCVHVTSTRICGWRESVEQRMQLPCSEERGGAGRQLGATVQRGSPLHLWDAPVTPLSRIGHTACPLMTASWPEPSPS